MGTVYKGITKKRGDSKMGTKMEQIKQKMKEDYARKADEYFLQYDGLKENGEFNIDEMEKLLGDGITAAKEVLIETLEEMMKQEVTIESDTDGKKKLAYAEKP